MSDYQAVYDAVRSRITGVDIGEAVRSALDFSFVAQVTQEEIRFVCSQYVRPSVLFRPVLTKDGDSWIALHGPDLQTGVVGTGDTPESAMADFDRVWSESA